MAPPHKTGVTVVSADWPAPPGIRAFTTTRRGGVSDGPYRGLNLAAHVGDDAAAVQANRRVLAAALGLPAEPLWLAQEHGIRVVDAADIAPGTVADAAVARRPDMVCAVLTADCLPLVLCDRAGTRVAAVHAGWRGLADGVIGAAVAAMGGAGGGLMAWLGPAIGPRHFEIGDDVRRRLDAAGGAATGAFRAGAAGKWYADLYRLAGLALRAQGVTQVYGGGRCTYTEDECFYSYRRDGVTGRMATLVWIRSD